jgi:hypothetical protein
MAAHCGGIDFIDLCLGRRISCRCSLSRLKADYLKGPVVIKARVKLQGRIGLGFHPQKPLGQFKLALGQASCAAIAVAQKAAIAVAQKKRVVILASMVRSLHRSLGSIFIAASFVRNNRS